MCKVLNKRVTGVPAGAVYIGRDLVCAPLPCHGDLLCRLANATRDERIAWWRAVKAAA